MTFADGRGNTRACHALQRVGVCKGLRRARIEEGDTVELHSNGAAVDLDFGGEGRVVHRYHTSNKTRSLFGEQGRVLVGEDGGHHSEDIASVVRWYVWQRVGVVRRRSRC